MKIHPPIPGIPADAPYKNDLFKRQTFGNSLFSLFKSVQENIVLCVDAPWGEGKTTFARMWLADLKRRGVNCIYFDAFAHDYADEPFVAFCGEILTLAETSFADNAIIQTLRKDFKSKAKRIGAKLLCTSTRIGVKALPLGIIKDSDIAAMDSIRTDIADATSARLSSFMDAVLDDYISSKKSLEEFRAQLSDLGAAVRAKQNFPLLIVVDELDRCRPDFALSLVERIKHLFAAKDVSFLLLANTAQLQNYVKSVYGSHMDNAENYLGKFFTLTASLPQNRGDTSDNDYSKYTRRLIEHYGIGKYEIESILPRLFQYYRFSLREMERCFSILTLYFAQLQPNQTSFKEITAFLSVLRIRHPGAFDQLLNCTLTYEQLLESTNLDKIEDTDYLRFSKDWFLWAMRFFLLTDQQFEALDEKDKHLYAQAQWPLIRHRTKVLSRICSDLVRFSLNEP